METRLREQPNDFRSQRALSWVYLALGRKADAISIARHTLDLLPPEKDAVLGSGNLAALAQIQAQTGAATEAVQNLKKLLSISAGETISIARLKIDPVWDPIRNDPGFQQLLTMKDTSALRELTFQMFQHVTVLVSFIFAIALTHVFSSASQLLLARTVCAFPPLLSVVDA